MEEVKSTSAQIRNRSNMDSMKHRRTVNALVLKLFTDLDDVTEDLGKQKMSVSCLQCIQHCIEELPQMFVEESSLFMNMPEESSVEMDFGSSSRISSCTSIVSLAFTEWLVSRILRLLSFSAVSYLHSDCEDVLVALFTVVRCMDGSAFSKLVTQLVQLLVDLQGFCDLMYSRGIQEDDDFSIKQFIIEPEVLSEVTAAKEEERLDLSTIPVVFNDPYACEMLQARICEMMTRMASEILQFTPEVKYQLWSIICLQVQLGCLTLKKASLETVRTLMKCDQLPLSKSIICQLLSSLESLLRLYCSGEVYSLVNAEELEETVALILTELTLQLERANFGFVCDPIYIHKYLYGIIEVLEEFGMQRIKSYTLKESVVNSVINLMNVLDKLTNKVSSYFLMKMKTAFLNMLGKLSNSKCLISVLVHLLKLSAEPNTETNAENAKESERHGVKRGADGEILPTENESCFEEANLNPVLKIFKRLLSEAREAISEEEILLKLQGIHTTMKILFLYQIDQLFFFNDSCQNLDEKWKRLSRSSSSHIAPTSLSSILNICNNLASSQCITTVVLQEIILFLTTILESQEFLFWKPEVLSSFCSILSIPWFTITNQEDWQDVSAEHVTKHLQEIWKCVSTPEIMALSLNALSMMTASVSSYWRVHIIKLALMHEETIVKIAALETLPIHFHSLGLTNPGILHELLMLIIPVKDLSVQKNIASLVGILHCIIARCSVLVRERVKSSESSLVARIKLQCRKCSGAKDDGSSLVEVPWLQDLFLRCLHSPDSEVRIIALGSTKSFFTHSVICEEILSSYMTILEDYNYNIRVVLSKKMKCIVDARRTGKAAGWTPSVDEVFIARLKTATVSARSSGNIRLQETLLLTLGQIGQWDDNELLLIVVISLIENLQSNIPLVLAVARSQLRELARSKELKLMEIFKMFKQAICKHLMEEMLEKCNHNSDPLDVLVQVVNVFGFADIRSFLLHTLCYILPPLVCKGTPNVPILVKSLAKEVKMRRQEILMKNFTYIFSHVVRNCNKTEREKTLLYVQNATDIEIGSLIRCDFQRIHNELLLHLSTHYKETFGALCMLAAKDENYKGPTNITKVEEMADYLQPRLLGFLTFFDSQLLNSSIMLSDKELALTSLISIMELMGRKYITVVRIKLMATLRIALRFTESNFLKICCKAWNTFVCSVELTTLGPMLNQIISTLLPLLQLEPKGVSKIFKFLIVENREVLSDFFHDLYFVPEIEELQEVNFVLKEYLQKPNRKEDFSTLLSQSLKGISHENLHVRIHALNKVKQLLQTHQEALHSHLLGRESVDPIISLMKTMMLDGCRETDKRVRLILAECFGELSAVDPGRLDMKDTGPAKSSQIYESILDENFAYDLIQVLVHSFLAAEDTRIQDCSSFALQEMLQIYKCKENSTCGTAKSLWDRFAPDVQENLIPLMNSRYIMSNSKKKVCYPKPICGSKMGSTFKEWVIIWTTDVVAKVKHEMSSKVFHCCSVIIKHDLNVALFLLPHIILYTIQDASDEDKHEVYEEIVAVLSLCKQPLFSKSSPSDLRHLTAQVVFSVLDYLTMWIQKQNAKDLKCKTVIAFVDQIPRNLLAQAACECQAFTRALTYLEQHLRAHPEDVQANLKFLQKIYVSLDETDGVAGVSAIRKEVPTLREQILDHEATGQLHDAFVCYERAVRLNADDVTNHQGLLKCLMGLDQPNTALTYASGLLETRPEWVNEINCYRVEAAWKLASWDNLASFCASETSVGFGVGVGKILHAAHEKNSENFLEQLKIVRSDIMGPLSAASMEGGAYERGYQYLTRLHMLTDLEKGLNVFLNIPINVSGFSSEVKQHLECWHQRRKLVESSMRYQEPMLNLQRVLLSMARSQHPEMSSYFEEEIIRCWLLSAKLARKNVHQQRAYSCLLEVSTSKFPEVFMEKAKWQWSKGEQQQAINVLQKGIQETFPDAEMLGFRKTEKEEQLACAKAKLLLANYSKEAAILESNALIDMYKDVVSIHEKWEEGHFHLAKYSDLVLSTIVKLDKRAPTILNIMKSFGESLKRGCTHIYHSMPRMLALWFEFGAQMVELNLSKKPNVTFLKQLDENLTSATKIIEKLLEELPAFYFLTAFPQLISRICHSHPSVAKQLQKIIAKLLYTFPLQAMWMLLAVSKSSYRMRVTRCQEVFEEAKQSNSNLTKFIQDCTRFADILLQLCNKQITDEKVFSINKHLRNLPRMLDDRNMSKILLPLQSMMTVNLPSNPGRNFEHNPFPQALVYIHNFLDTVELLPSLQRPKKVTIRGSDGKLYTMMCKPKDDLRKDCRLMEFNNLVNRYLKRDSETRSRQLHIRTYTVVPLNEECGLIEWVPNLLGLRQILNVIYKERNMYVTGREIQNMMPTLTMSLEKKLNIFKEKFLPKFPPVFNEWFIRTFPDPTAWYMARLSYARTVAVMSMVGYILGLGDRHGENILFDSSCGDTIHVDFNCLFNKGETFDWPERVPFRLTHNMIDALGPTGYEGIFRKACEATMRVMRNEMDTLMSMLRPFIHDPLVEWGKVTKNTSKASDESGEISNEKALVHVCDIEQRLKGIVQIKNKPHGLPLSIEGQVNFLIQEATDVTNLCQMYVGWAAYM